MTRPAAVQALERMELSAAALTRAVIEAADADGVSVLLVGGPVRDLLLGRPLVDVDLLVDDPDPERAGELAERAAAAVGEGAGVTRHERFGTATLRGPDAALDLATVRSESYAHDGALPTVGPGTLEQDLARRDFTVNALALPLSRSACAAHPEIVDLVGGRADLGKRRLRILHERSFHDDPTRALRAARFLPRLDFALGRPTRTSLRNALRDGAFSRVSGERLRREVVKLFEDASQGVDPSRSLRLLHDWHVLGALEPGLELPRDAVLPLRRLGRAIAQPPWPPARWRPWLTGLGLWLGPFPAQLRRRTLRRLALRGDPARRVVDLPRAAERCLRALPRARGRGAVDALLAPLGEEELFGVYALAEAGLRRRIARFAADDRHRKPPVSGADLTEAGLSGPTVGRALERIRAAWLDGAVRSRDEALALAAEVARRRPRTRSAGSRTGKSRRKTPRKKK